LPFLFGATVISGLDELQKSLIANNYNGLAD
jgi:hypothetical protein